MRGVLFALPAAIVGWYVGGLAFIMAAYVVRDSEPGCDLPWCGDEPWWRTASWVAGASVALLFAFAAWRISTRFGRRS
jgi:hypothetical protein